MDIALIMVALSLILFGLFDIFERWYTLYLKRLNVSPHLIRLLQRLKWVLLSFIFWEALVSRRLVSQISVSHLLYALFIFSLFRLVLTLYPERSRVDKESIS